VPDQPASPAPSPARRLTLLDALGIGINGVVGSGVYLLVSPLAQRAGAASVAGVVACGLLCTLIALCFAELSSMHERSGGPYLYAREAFGRVVGFAVGWLGAATGLLGFAAVANGFAATLARSVPAVGSPTARAAVALTVVLLFGAINLAGVHVGGRTSTVLSIAKLGPLLLLVVLGLPHVTLAVLGQVFVAPPIGPGGAPVAWGPAVASAAFLAIFMHSGFEYAVVPAGEIQNPRRNVPLAVVGSLLFASALYAVLQVVSLSVLPDLGHALAPGAQARTQPLLDVAQALLGAPGNTLLSLAALVSMLGFCAGVALVAPRYLVALSQDDYLPKAFAVHSARGTPALAIALSTALVCALSLALGYTSLVDASNVVILSGYALTALAALVLRFRQPAADRPVRLPFGVLIPAAACLSAVLLLWQAHPAAAEWKFTLQLDLLGLALWGATALWRKLRPSAASVPSPS
jgi:amino acid transporter